MKCSCRILIPLALITISAFHYSRAQAISLLSDNFSSAGLLNGKTPPVTTGGASWITLTGTGAPSSNGSTLTLPAQNQSAVLDLGANFFSNHPGLYALSADVTVPAGSSISFIGIGFLVNPVLTQHFGFATSNPGLNPDGGPNGGSPWIGLLQNGTLEVNNPASTYIYQSGANAYPSGTTHTLKLVLDTSTPQWTLTGAIDATPLDLNGSRPGSAYVFTTNPTNIRYVGLSSLTMAGVSYTVDNFSLTYAPSANNPAAENAPPVRPYYTAWVEGESYMSQVGGSVVTDATAYGGKAWQVAGSNPGASATYSVNIPAPGPYLFSLAGQGIGTSNSSPISYSVDGAAAVPSTALATSSTAWGASSTLHWNNVAALNFSTAGSHTVTVALTGTRPSDGTYAYAIDALAFVAQPATNLLYTEANFATAQWGASASASSANATYPSGYALDGNPTLGWESNTSSPAQSTLTVTFPGARNLEVLRLVKGNNPPAGASMPTSYNVDLLENGNWVRRVNETANAATDVSYQLPGIVTATAARLTVIGTQGNNYPYVNYLAACGPWSPEILAPASGSTVGSNPYNVVGVTQLGATVNLLVNGSPGPVVTADGSGWFTGVVTLGAGANTVGAQSGLNALLSLRQSSAATYNATVAASLAATDRKCHHVVVNEGGNNVVVTGVKQGVSVGYTVADENGTTVGSGTLDLSKGAAPLALPASTAGWYQLTLNGSPSLTQSISVLPNNFVLPAISPVSSDIALGQVKSFVPASDQPSFVAVVSDYAGMSGIGWSRDRLSWTTANPSVGTYAWTTYDTNFSALIAQGQNVMPLVYDFPPFLNSHNDYRYVPDDLRDTYNWGVALATHYKGLVKAYEFQNEFDWASTALQTVNTLMGHQRAFYLGVKSVDPTAIVAPNPPAFIADVANECQNLRGEAADVFTFHWYPYGAGQTEINAVTLPGTGYNLQENFATVAGLLENRAAWMSECGYIGIISGPDLPSSEELFQADFYAKMASAALSYGIDKPFAFILPYYYEGTKEFGMLRQSGFSPRPAVNSFSTAANVLRTARYYGSLNTGNANIEGLVFVNADGSYLLEIWALNSSGVGSYTLPGGVTKVGGATDYLGRTTDTASASTVGVQTTAKFLALNGSTVTSVTTPSANPYPNPSRSGVAPSPVVMSWHIALPCKSAQFEDYYNLAQGAATACTLEIVNLSATASFTGTVAVAPSNPRWILNTGSSLVAALPPMGRTTIPFTLTAPSGLMDNVRIEARVDDGSGHTSSAAEILQTTGSTTLPSAITSADGKTITIDCTAPSQNYYGYDGHLHWTAGADGTVNYLAALPAAGVTFTGSEKFRAPLLDYFVTFPHGGTWYYVWVKARAGTGTSNLVNVSVAENPASVNLANSITGFNASGWTWSRTVVGTATPAQLGISSTNNKNLNVWANDDGMQISKIVLTTDVNFVPSN